MFHSYRANIFTQNQRVIPTYSTIKKEYIHPNRSKQPFVWSQNPLQVRNNSTLLREWKHCHSPLILREIALKKCRKYNPKETYSRRSKLLKCCAPGDSPNCVSDPAFTRTLTRPVPRRYIRNKVIRRELTKVSATIDTERPIVAAICGSTCA